jgi:hypothetical protein
MKAKPLMTAALAMIVFALIGLAVGNALSWIGFEEKNNDERTIALFLSNEAKAIAAAYKTEPVTASSPDYLSQYKDYWGNPLKVVFQKTTLVVTSAGPDRIFGTSDDIKVEERIHN